MSVLVWRGWRKARGMLMLFALAAIGAPLAAGAADSSGSPTAQGVKPTPCFFRRDWDGGWKVTPDARTLYIRVSGAVYRLQLVKPYPLLKSPFAVLDNVDANDAICSPLDFKFSVTDRIGNWETPIVKRMTLLTAAQAAALPRKLRP
jgi:hypothetical protein